MFLTKEINSTPMSRMLCHALLATFWLPGMLCTAADRKIAVHFTDGEMKVVGEKEYSMSRMIFEVSGFLKREVEEMIQCSGDHIDIEWGQDVFEMAAEVLDDQLLGRASAEEIARVLGILDRLDINKNREAVCYRAMARSTVEQREDWYSFAERVMEMHGDAKARSIKIYALQLLREWAREHGMCVAVSGDGVTLCTVEYHRTYREREPTDEVGVFSRIAVLVGRKLGAYKQHPDVFSLLRMVTNAMGIPRIDVSIICWTPDDKRVIEEFKKAGKLGWLEISCSDMGPRAIHTHFQEFKGDIVGLDVSRNMRLGGADWRTVGDMTALRSLKMASCKVKSRVISAHFQELGGHLEELDVSWNRKLGDTDWETVGKMEALRRLNVAGCGIVPGKISAYFHGLQSNLEELSVSWNRALKDEDWKTIGGMAALKKLRIEGCEISPEARSTYLGKLTDCEIMG